MAHQVANHATGAEHPEYLRSAGGFGLRIALHLRAPDLARLGRIQPRYALEQQLVVLRREARAKISAEWNDLGLRRCGQENASRKRGRQAA
jgi:hypothetical protein